MALTKVSIVLTVNDTAKIIIIVDKNSVLSFSRMEKKAKSEFRKAIEYYEKSYAIDNNDRATAQSLMQLYGKTGNTVKFKEMKAILAN